MTDTDNTGKPPANNTQLQPPKPKSWFQRIFIDVNPLRLIGGLLLIILVFAAAFCAVIFFAAAQFQSRVAELSLNGAPMTICRVNDFRDEFKSWSRTSGSCARASRKIRLISPRTSRQTLS